jgi:flagellar biosynthesis protein FlhB
VKLPAANAGWLGIAYYVFGAVLAILFTLAGIEAINEYFPYVLPSLEWFIGRLVRLSSDEYVGDFVRDRLLVFAVIGVVFVLWVTHKWPTLVKTIGQALNPFARVGVATVSAVAAVLIALILAGPLGQSKSEGECASSFHLSLDHAPSLVSNTTCEGGKHGRDGN